MLIPAAEPGDEPPAATIRKSELEKLPRVEPGFIEPMHAKLVDNLLAGNQWAYEAKFDGIEF